jgi:hypothetical protein
MSDIRGLPLIHRVYGEGDRKETPDDFVSLCSV